MIGRLTFNGSPRFAISIDRCNKVFEKPTRLRVFFTTARAVDAAVRASGASVAEAAGLVGALLHVRRVELGTAGLAGARTKNNYIQVNSSYNL